MNAPQKHILRSAVPDLQGEHVTLENLQDIQAAVNAEKKMRMLVNHRRDLPPLGFWDEAEITKENNIDTVKAAFVRYGSPEPVDGTDLFIRHLDKPVIYTRKKTLTELTMISWDRSNFSSKSDYLMMKRQMAAAAPHEISFELHTRKSALTSPEVVISMLIAQPYLYGILKKLGEKTVDNISDDTYKAAKKQLKLFVAWVKKLHKQTRQRSVPKNKKLVTVFEIMSDPYIELVARTDDPDHLAKGFSTTNLEYIGETVSNLSKMFKIAECCFSLNDKGRWKLGYLLTEDGYVIGSKPVFNEQEKLAKRILSSPTSGFSVGGYSVKYNDLE
ncbi:MAG TPA: hypothetical protein VJ552_09430 [Sediminibacterium sp.]|nr:hypothetical protein [Sediminibacterium sp.]